MQYSRSILITPAPNRGYFSYSQCPFPLHFSVASLTSLSITIAGAVIVFPETLHTATSNSNLRQKFTARGSKNRVRRLIYRNRNVKSLRRAIFRRRTDFDASKPNHEIRKSNFADSEISRYRSKLLPPRAKYRPHFSPISGAAAILRLDFGKKIENRANHRKYTSRATSPANHRELSSKRARNELKLTAWPERGRNATAKPRP